MTDNPYQPQEPEPVGRQAAGIADFVTNRSIIYRYNPHRMPPDHVLDTFTGREKLLDELLAMVTGPEPAHVFLYGPRGIGKTTMLLMLRYKIAATPRLSRRFDIVQFSEEERRVANLPSFAVRVLERLAAVRPEAAADLEKTRAAALSAPEETMDYLLEAGARQPDRPILLLLDNFDELALAVLSGKSQRFKAGDIKPLDKLEALMTCGSFRIVATALQAPEKRKNFPKSLLNHFRLPIRLEPLPDAAAFLRKRANKDRRKGFLERLPALARRIEGLNRLAAGNPRLLVFLYECLGDLPLLDLVDLVQRILDDLTPMYQDVLDRLVNPGQAAVLEMLAARGGVGTAEDIAAVTYQGKQTVLTALNDLADLGLVIRPANIDLPGEPEKGEGGRVIFRTHPPLFQIWYEMRHFEHPGSLLLVRFLSHITEPEEAGRLFHELRAIESAPVKEGLAGILEDIVLALDPEWNELREIHLRDVLNANGTYMEALSRLDEAMAATSADQVQRRIGLYVIRSEVQQALGDPDGAEKDLDAAGKILDTSPDVETRIKLLTARSRWLKSASRYSEAATTAREAVSLCTGSTTACTPVLHGAALLALAGALLRIGNLKEAEALATEAGKLLDTQDRSRLQGMCATILANIYLGMGDYLRAREYHERSLTIRQEINDRSGQANSLGNLGNVFQSLGEYGRAREYHEQSLAIKQEIGDRFGQAMALGSIGRSFAETDEKQAALVFYEKAHALFLEIGAVPYITQSAAGITKTLFSLAATALQSKALSDANLYADRAFDFTEIIGLERLLSLFTTELVIPCLQASRNHALTLRQVLEKGLTGKTSAPDLPQYRLLSALLGYYAEDRSREAFTDMDPTAMSVIQTLVDRIERPRHVQARELLKAGKANDASRIYEEILETEPEDLEAGLNLATALAAENRLDEAEAQVRRILAVHKDLVPARLILARILMHKRQFKEAAAILAQLMDDPRVGIEEFPTMARLLRELKRFEDLAVLLDKWRSAVAAQPNPRLDVWIPEAWLLAGRLDRARTAMPPEDFLPEAPVMRLLLGLLRVFMALHAQDADRAREQAAQTLAFASDLPPDENTDVFDAELYKIARENLGQREFSFLMGLNLAVSGRVSPLEFAHEYLSQAEVDELSRRMGEERQLVLAALSAGRLRGFGDLFRVSGRKIGPATGISALGETFRDLSKPAQSAVLEILTTAVKQGGPVEAAAALGAMSVNFPELSPLRRAQCLTAILDLISAADALRINRVKALGFLNILYPHLTAQERQEALQAAAAVREDLEGTEITEFFNETVPQSQESEKE